MSDEEDIGLNLKKRKGSRTLQNQLESQKQKNDVEKPEHEENGKMKKENESQKRKRSEESKVEDNTKKVKNQKIENSSPKKTEMTTKAATTPKNEKSNHEQNKKDSKDEVKKETKDKATKNGSASSQTPKKSRPQTTPNKKKKPVEEEEEEDSSEDSADSGESSDEELVSSEEEEEEEEDDDDDDDDEEEYEEESVSRKKTPSKKTASTKKSPPKKETKQSNKAKKETKKETKQTPKKETKKTTKKDTKKSKDSKQEKQEKKKKSKEDEEPVYKWWLEEPLPPGKKWKTLEHSGVLFPPPYEPHGVPLIYDGEKIKLSPEQEEIASYFAQYLETDHVKKPQFIKNFFDEFKKILKKSDKKTKITDFKKCDFSLIHKYIMEQREIRRNRSKEEKQQEKEEKEKLQEKFGYAIVDGYKQKIANFRIEPPGLFLGRGDHPKAGMLKKRVMPEDVTLNLGKKAPIPECPVPGHNWGKIVRNDEVSWLAFWKDNINDSFKYVWLAPSSRIKGEADMKKFETARKLKNHIEDIRKKYTTELKSKDLKVRQRATALYVIDHLALRVGNEKDDDQADTVGCCSLRVEHIKLHEPNTVEFDFLGKDSMRYQNTVEVSDQVFKNFRLFCKSKKPKDELFDQLTTTALNAHLKQQMEGLTAKVFRTYNASITLERELNKITPAKDELVDKKMLHYNRANREVAILCNHQRTVSKNFNEQVGKIDEKIQEIDEQISELKAHLKAIKSGKPPKKPKKKEGEEKVRKLPEDPEKITKQIERLKERKTKWETKKTEKDELKTVSLTTSKINYLDPRISVAWAKRNGVPVEKIFSKTLRQKFPWAMDVDEDWKF